VGLEVDVRPGDAQLLDGARVAEETGGAGQFAGMALELEALLVAVTPGVAHRAAPLAEQPLAGIGLRRGRRGGRRCGRGRVR